MAVTPYELRSYPGAAGTTKLQGSITASALAFNVQPGTGNGYPDGSSGPFFVVLDLATTSEEKVHCTSRTGDAFVVDVRGADGTTALPHGDQASVSACWTATDAQEGNVTAYNTIGQIASKGDVLTGSSANALHRTAVGSDGAVMTADSSQTGGVRWDTAAAAATAASITTLTTNQTADEATIAGHTAELATHAATLTKIAAPLSAMLAADHTTTANIFTINLSVGTWVINVNAQALLVGASAGVTLTTTPTAGITLTGSTTSGAVGGLGTGSSACCSLTFVAVVGTSGHVTVTATMGAGSGTTLQGNPFTGYTAIQVA